MYNSAERFAEAFARTGYRTAVFSTAEEMKLAVLNEIQPGESVGIGGSMTVQQLGLYESMKERGNRVFWHWKQNDPDTLRSAHYADVYLMSSNAATLDGKLINIDGTGNRVSALCHGPGRVYILLGSNKLVVDEREGIERLHNIACPRNAVRLGLDTPCARIGHCTDCASPQRMCHYRVVLDRPPRGHEIIIFFCGEELGF